MQEEKESSDSRFEKLLKEAQKQFRALPKKRTPNCPADEDLRAMCYDGNNSHLKKKYMRHVALCPYCSDYVHKEIQAKIARKESSDNCT